jgi:hypothetical protein
MSETVKPLFCHQQGNVNTFSVSDLRIPADEDDAFLDFYQPPVIYEHGASYNPNIKKLISPYQEDAFTEEVLYEVVNNRLGFVLPYHLWEEINEAFTYYWDEVVGLDGDILKGAMFISIRDYLIADFFYCPDELLQEIVIAIEEFILTIPGVVIQD